MLSYFTYRLSKSAYWKDIAWQASGNGLAQAIGVLGMPLLTRLYTPQDFALQNLFLQIVGFVTGVMTWRYEYFIQLPEDDKDSKHLLYLVLFIGGGTFITVTPLAWGFRHEISYWIGSASLAPWLTWVPLTALLICYALAIQHRVQRNKNYKQSGLSELVSKSTYISCGIIGSCFGGGGGLIAATGAGALGKITWLSKLSDPASDNLATSINVTNKKRIDIGSIQRLAIKYARLASSMVISHLLVNSTVAIPAVFIAHTYGAEVLGQFALVISTLYLPSGLIGNAIGQVYYQRAAEHKAKGEGFAPLWRTTARRLFFIGLPLYTVAAIISPWAYPLIFGNAWAGAGRYATIMTMSAFFSFISSPMDRSSLVVGVWWYLPIWQAIRVITILGVLFIAWRGAYRFEYFLTLLVLQMSVMYLVDYWAEWRFSAIHLSD